MHEHGSIGMILDHASVAEWRAAAAALKVVANETSPDDLHALDVILADKPCCRHLGRGLYRVGRADPGFDSAAQEAYAFVETKCGVAPLVVVECAPVGVPAHVHVSDRLARIAVAGGTPDLAAALVHEFAHSAAISGVGFLDEGFATLIERNFQGLSTTCEWWERPLLGALLDMDWTADPHFEALDAPDADAPYRLAAWMVGTLVDAMGMAPLIGLLTRLRRRHRGTLVDLEVQAACGIDLVALDAIARPGGGASVDAARILAEGDAAAAEVALPGLRAAVAAGAPQALDQLACVAITLAITRFDATGAVARSEARWAIKRLSGNAAPLLLAYRDLLDSFDAASPIERRSAGARAVDRFATLIDAQCDGESLIAAAKAQTYAPRAFLDVADWRARLIPLVADPRLGVAASRLIDHPQFAGARAC